jgi:fibronectin-binding autotransporter adhesin
MNKIYRLVWSETKQGYVAAAEITKSQKKKSRSTLQAATAIALTLASASAYADDVQWASVYPSYLFPTGVNYDAVVNTGTAFTIDNDTGTANHFASGTTLNILGPIPSFAAGSSGAARPVLVRNALSDSTGADQGRITTITSTSSGGASVPITSANIDQFSYSTNPVTPLQNQELNVEVPGLEGSYSVVSVYDSTTFSAPGASQVGNLTLPVYDPNSFQIYNNFSIASIESVGGTANINVGSDTASATPILAPTNSIELLAKNSILARASATDVPTSTVNWQSDNYIHFAPAPVISGDQQNYQAVSSQYNDTITLPNYVKVGERIGLSPINPSLTFPVLTKADIAKVNDFLLGQGAYSGNSQIQLWLSGGVTLPVQFGSNTIDSVTVAQNTYDGIITSLLQKEEQNRVNLSWHVWEDGLAHTNNATLATGDLNIIYATGFSAAGNVTETGSLAVDGASAVMRADNNATLTNNGNINLWRSSSLSPAGIGMQATNATATNIGTLNAGLLIEKNGSVVAQHNQGTSAMQGSDTSTLNNTGYINVALPDTTSASVAGMRAQVNTTATNSGSIAIVGNPYNAEGRSPGIGADISGASTFINTGTGRITVGTTAITGTLIGTPSAMIGSSVQSAGISTSSSGTVTNEGTVTLGLSTRNAVGMLVDGAAGAVTNNGIINVLGNLVNGAAAPNYGLSVIDTSNVTNNGQINVLGDNNVAINVLAEQATASVNSTASGTITVGGTGDTGNSDGNPFTYRNYAVYAEGVNAAATANISSTIRLLAAGAIGVHARGTATVNVTPAATLTFNNTNQIGYYAYGQDAKINLSNATLNDNLQSGSILFVVDHGAIFDGTTGASALPFDLTVAGVGSTGVFANGRDDGPDGTIGTGDDVATTLNTGPATIRVNGENGVGVKVTGGASGTINNGGIILGANNTTAVVVDGRNYSINGDIGQADQALPTAVTSFADTETTASQSGIKGYDVSHDGQVTINGDGMRLAGNNNIGLYLHDGGVGVNNAPIEVSGTNNIGVYIQDRGTLTNSRDIIVSGAANSGNVGVKVQGAGAQVTQLGSVTANGGLAAVQLINNGATLTLGGTNNLITASGGADGIRLDAGASSLTASGTTINISGSGAGINNNADSSNISLNGVTINAGDGPAIRTAVTFDAEGAGNILNVAGSGSGFAFERPGGLNTTGDLTIGTGYTINGTGLNSVGILARTNGSVNSGANITMGGTAGAAISAADASSVTNSGTIQTSSNVNSTILANNASSFTNSGSVTATGILNGSALVQINGAAANRTILNTGTLSSTSPTQTIVDASGAGNNTITNQGTLSAGDAGATAILSGSGSDAITLAGGSTQGEIIAGSGSDSFTWNSGTLAGGVTFSGADGNDNATLGNVNTDSTLHLLSEGGSNNTLTFNSTSAVVGSLGGDNISIGTNIGSGWSQLTLNGADADVRVTNDLALSGAQGISVNGGATLRSGNNAVNAGKSSINDFSVVTSDPASLLVFDGSQSQTYSGVISGNGGLERTGGSTTLLGNNTYTGSTLIDSGAALQLGNGGTTGGLSTQTAITDNGVLTVNRSDAVALNGAITGSGEFHQDGAGVTRLGGINSYGGVTQVNQGMLLVNGNQQAATGDTTVAAGVALGGTGTIGGNTTFGADTVLTPGDGGAGGLTVNGSLNLSSTTNSQFDLGQVFTPGGALNDLVTVGQNLLLDGVVNVSLTPGGLFAPGIYRLFNYGGALTNQGLDIGTLPVGNTSVYSVQTALPGQVNLVVGFDNDGANLEFWDGSRVSNSQGPTGIEGDGTIQGGDGVWYAGSLEATNNWTTENGQGNAPWQQRQYAVFSGTGGNVVLSDIDGSIYNAGMQFTVDGYNLSGGAGGTVPLNMVRSLGLVPSNNYAAEGETAASAYYIVRVGAGGAGETTTATLGVNLVEDSGSTDVLKFLKYDPGRLILTGSNGWRGGTEIYGGTLQVSADENLGLAGTSILINNNSTLQIGADFTTPRPIFLSEAGGGQFDLYGNTFTPTGLIGGAGQLRVKDTSAGTDSSVLNLDRANTYQGDTTITGKNGSAAVTVNANATGALGKANSVVTVNQQGTLAFNNEAQAESHAFTLDNGTLNFNDTASAANSTVTAQNGGVVTVADNATGGQGLFTILANSTLNLIGEASAGLARITNTGTVNIADAAQAESATVANNAGGVVNASGVSGTTTVGSLSGAGTIELGAATLNEGSLNLNDTISGVISGSGSLGKVGSGTLTLTGENTWTGATSVQQGVLLVNGNQRAATGNVTVNSGATLGGAGVIGGAVNVADNAHLAAGAELNSVGELTTGAMILNQNSQLDFQFGRAFTAGGALNDLINVNGDLNLDGKLNITQTPGGSFDVGVYRVFNYTGSLTNNILDIGTAPPAADDLYVQTSVAGQVNLINRTGVVLNFWDGNGPADGSTKNNREIEGGDGVWQNSAGNDNWSTDAVKPAGRINAPFSDGSFAIFGGEAGNVTVDNSLGEVRISGAQFTTDGYVINDGTITTNTADTKLRVGDGSLRGARYTTTINSVIAGSGGINKTDLGTLLLNGENSYAGGTTVSGGVLQVARDASLGQAGTNVALNGGTLRYGAAFDTARAVILGLTGGTIDTNGNNVSLLSAVSGLGALTKVGAGKLTLTQDSTYLRSTTISEGNLQLGTGGETGGVTGNILNNGVLQVNRSNTLLLNGDITGSGQLWQQGSGSTILSGNNSYSGTTLVESGTLRALGANKFSADSAHVVSRGALLDTGGQNQTVGALVNQGTVSLRGREVGSTLTVNGDYVGLDGTLQIAAQQHSPGVADRLVINGGTASGRTLLDIDVSQLGEQTDGDGIAVVQATNGATTTAQTTKDAFTLGADHLEAGAWEYRLFAGNAQGQGEDWFLRTAYRPEVPVFTSVASTLRQADLAVLGTLHLRVGDEEPYNVNVPEDNEPRFWARYIAQSSNQKLNDQTRSESDSSINGMQMGFDLYYDQNWRAGLYTTVLDVDSSIKGENSGGYGVAGYNSTLSVYLGGYATWTHENGFYVDNVLQYGNHSVDLKNQQQNDTYSPDGNSYLASVEVGKPWALGDSNWSIEPQAQLIWQHSDFDSVTLKGDAKTRASIDADDAIIGRLGLRLSADYDTSQGKLKPYVRVNLWQELSDGSDTASFENTASNAGATTITADQQYSTTEVAVGTTWVVTKDVQAYTEVGRSFQNGGSNSKIENDFNGSLGMKIRF